MNRHETEFNAVINQAIASQGLVQAQGGKHDTIVLEKYLRISDLVIMQMDEESRHYCKGVPNGTVGVVIGFRRFIDYRARINNFGHTPGKYARNGCAMVRWLDGSVSEPSAGNLRWLFDHEKKTEERRNDRLYNEAFEYEARIDDLPNLPFWEMDIVTFRPKDGHQPWSHTTRGRVVSIDYHNLESRRSDGSPMPIYNCTPLEDGYGRVCLEETELVLVEQGNLWKWFNDQRDSVKFATLEEEIAFHSALGQLEQVKCEQTRGYHWPFSAILPALQAGTIDVVKRSPGFFGASDSMDAYKLTDLDLSQRVREESIRGYTQDTKLRILGEEWNDFTRGHVIRRALEFGLPFVNVQHEGGYVDTTQLEILGIPVVNLHPQDVADKDFPKGSYIYFSPKVGGVDIPHTSTHEVDEAAQKLARAFKRNHDDHFQVRVQSDSGWSEKNRDIVIAACKAYGVPFADRAGVADEVMRASGIDVIMVADGKMPLTFEIDGYVFFTHRGIDDLSYDVTINGF